ncbi:uracil-DNA glycosylase [Sciscionella sediminilitoris]|uniref:uracil-DNA glycosylase n=1 Tax=Sciscionella sediminilitoris TaxID=1445613 RepID=UPI0004DF05BB|nr:uracil-DNA glycosylase [Sciscionella sp. SE31]
MRTPERIAPEAGGLAELDSLLTECRACPRLVAWREHIAEVKRAAFADQRYWGRPVPGFGPPDARILIIGLAPAAHGANRTGRMFTGDRSGDVLYAALHAEGLASQPHAIAADDGLSLRHTRITSPVHCAPPENKPTTAERDTCRPWLHRELELLAPSLRVVLTLGAFGWSCALTELAGAGWPVPKPRPKFAHGASAKIGELTLLGCYHVSQQNTFTGRLTPDMVRAVLREAKRVAGVDG